MKIKTRRLAAITLLVAAGLGIWWAVASPQSGRAHAAVPLDALQFGMPASLVQNGEVRRESVVTTPDGPLPRTGPASLFQPLDNPIFGDNYIANTDTQGPPNLAQQEPSIAVNPTNPLNVVAMAKDERGGPNTKQTWIYTSTDGGVTWLNQIFPFAPQSPFSSDPIVNFSDDGICYVTSLPYGGGANDGIQVARSLDGGITFSPAVHLPGTSSGSDKEWTWVDNNPGSPFYHRVYVAWMDFATGGGWRLNYSTDRGVTFSTPSSFTNGYQFPMPVTLPNGDVIVTYRPTFAIIGYRRSTDGGMTFGSVATISLLTNPTCPPDNAGCGIWRMNAIPVNSVNRNNGTQVVVWNDGRAPNSTSIVYFSRSADNGTTWSVPAILAPPGVANTYQVEPWIEADEQGIFHAIWYDDRENPNTSIFHIYYSQSTDDGVTWSNATRISTATSDLRIGIPSSYNGAAGDYINVTASNGNVYGAWTDTRSGTGEDIYVVRGTYGGTATPTITGVVPTPTSTSTAVVATATRTSTPLPPTWTVIVEATTVTPLSPTSTRTSTRTATSVVTPTATACGTSANYTFATSTATIVPGTVDTGSHCDDCNTLVALPFPFTLYDQTLNSLYVNSNGMIHFNDATSVFPFSCLPATGLTYTMFVFTDDQLTSPPGKGIYTSVSGTAPNRIFNIEFRTCGFGDPGNCAPGTDSNYEVRLHESQSRFDMVYGVLGNNASSAVTGVQKNASFFTQYSCNTPLQGIPGLQVTYTLPSCGTITPTAIQPTATSTAANTAVLPTVTRTAVVSATSTTQPPTAVASATSTTTPCPITFTDVDTDNPFYAFIRCLACRGIISGYSDGTFRPNADISRGQIAKMVSNSAAFGEDPGAQIYEDVPPASPFYSWINRLSMRGHMGGYNCGLVPEEPCLAPARPYFRPSASATRGQLAKIVANAAGLGGTPSGIFYTDVQEDNPFYVWIMRLTTLNVMSGYPCGGPNEPCDEESRPYFRPFNTVTRGQASKIVANTFFPACQTGQR